MNTEEKLKLIEQLVYSGPCDESKSRKNTTKNLEFEAAREKCSLEPIAIIGMSGYMPKCMSLKDFWQVLDNDLSLIEEIPVDRFKWQEHYDPTGQDPKKMRSKWGGFIPNIKGFDSNFFNIPDEDAKLMDPRLRLLAMSIYSSLEDAGYSPSLLKGVDTGVFVGVEDNEYLLNLLDSGSKLDGGIVLHSANMLANHLSYIYDFRGPSETINTMSSSAAVAIHRAVSALRNGEISQAVVGTANLILRPDLHVLLSSQGQLSPTNTVNSFGKDAQGSLLSDSVASMILKPLSKAERDGDEIYATIKNSAVNYSGRGGGTLGTPNVKTHTEVVQSCYRGSGIDPRDVRYIEAQGMGNPVADIVEINAFNKALLALAQEQGVSLEQGQCSVSTLKPMMGHAQAASAMVSVFKVIRSFDTNKIHKILNVEDISPDLDFHEKPCKLAIETQDMPYSDSPRLAGVHSFGSGGNNAHLLIEEYVDKNIEELVVNKYPSTNRPEEPYMIVLSAKTDDDLRAKAVSLRHYLTENSSVSRSTLPRIAFTLQVGREAMDIRLAFIISTQQELESKLTAYIDGIDGVDNTYSGKVTSDKRTLSLLDMDEDMLNTVDAWIAKKKFSKLLGLWVNGLSLDWARLYGISSPKRLHLPTYPFSLTEYWGRE